MTEEEIKAEFRRKAADEGRLHSKIKVNDYVTEAVIIQARSWMVEVMAKAIEEKTECRFEHREGPHGSSTAWCTTHNCVHNPPTTAT